MKSGTIFALQTIGLDQRELNDLFRCIGAVMRLGLIEFEGRVEQLFYVLLAIALRNFSFPKQLQQCCSWSAKSFYSQEEPMILRSHPLQNVTESTLQSIVLVLMQKTLRMR